MWTSGEHRIRNLRHEQRGPRSSPVRYEPWLGALLGQIKVGVPTLDDSSLRDMVSHLDGMDRGFLFVMVSRTEI